jgi:BatD DUF11 like domain
MKELLKYILIPFFFGIYLTVNAQIPENQFLVELGNKKIKITEPFTIAITLQNFENTPNIQFPEIKGFQKRDQSTTRNYSSNGSIKTISTQIIKQNYYATKAGNYILPTFVINVNGQSIKSEGCTINAETVEGEDVISEAIFNENISTNDAILVVSSNKQRVFVGEGFNLRLSLIVSESNTAEMEFYMIESQITNILKKIKPANCWEENFGIKDINPFPILISGKKYTEYRIYEASFYPINTQRIAISDVNLTMKVSTGEGVKRISKFQNYTSKSIVVNVLPLPAHPLKNQVSVGDFRLEESVGKQKIQTGKSFSYQFKIIGEGNLSAAQVPSNDSSGVFDIYSPTVNFTTTLQDRRIVEEKRYDYTIIPKQSGSYELRDFFFWVFFNPQKQRYDTLRSNIRLKVGGQDIETNEESQVGVNTIYDGIEKLDSTQEEFDYQKTIKNIANVLIILMLAGMVFIFRKNE